VQQTVILRLRVSHSTAVTGLDVEPVQARDFILEELTGPPRTTRQSGPQQMTSDFVYALTPLTSGTLDLPPLRVHVAQDGAATEGAQAVPQVVSPGSEPPGLEVQALPGDSDAQLPLYALEVALRFDPRQRLQVGQPFEVSIVQQAAGAAGERLSDATALLKHPDFRIYPGQSHTSSRLVRNGQLLQGQRIDTLTLVPLRDGQLQLPAITLPWWDVTRRPWLRGGAVAGHHRHGACLCGRLVVARPARRVGGWWPAAALERSAAWFATAVRGCLAAPPGAPAQFVGP
jgi:hypothetical protein